MDPDDGVVPQQRGGNAVQKLSDLRTRWGTMEPETWKEAPQLIQIRTMEYIETWRLVAAHPSDPPKTVLANKYELSEKKKVP